MSKLADQIDNHILEVCRIVGDLYVDGNDDESAEVEMIVSVIFDALAKYDPKIRLLVTSSLYTNTLKQLLAQRENAA